MGYTSSLSENRIENAAKTAIVNASGIILAIIAPFVIRTLVIFYLGDEYSGFNSLVISIISMLNLAELGLADVIVFFLYEPLARGDVEKVDCYLNYLRNVYRYIGIAIMLVGGSITPFLPMLVTGGIPEDINPYLYYLIFLFASSLNYFVVPETLIIANATQRGYITGKVNLIGNILVYSLQMVSIIIFKSLLLYYISILVQCVFVSLYRYYIKIRHFGDFVPSGMVSSFEKKEMKAKILSLLGHQMDEKFISSIDNIVISLVLGLKMVTVYGNYMFVVSAIGMLIKTVFYAVTAGLGNAFVTEDIKSNYGRFRAILWLNGVIVVWAMGCMMCMYQPFMHIWMGHRILPLSSVILFCLYFFSSQIRRTVTVFKNASGMWGEDKYKPYVSMVVNLIIDLILVYTIGLNGALISSIICLLFIEIPWEGKVLYKEYFKRNFQEYISVIVGFLLFGIMFSISQYLLCDRMVLREGFLFLLLRGGICSFCFALLIVIVFGKSHELRVWKETVIQLLKRKPN